MIYTSYFAQLRNIPENIVPVAICRSCPRFYSGATYSKLAPRKELLSAYKRGSVDWDQYTKDYYATTLNKLDAIEVIDELSLKYGNDFVLICWEGRNKDCHRHLVAEWLRNNGYAVQEW